MKNNKIFYIFLITILAFLLRTYCLNKPEGLWYDEYFGWQIASQNDWGLFWQSILRNCHTPFYYFYLKFWIFLFGDSDLALRYSSVVPSVISVPVMYFVGEHLKDKKTGYFAAFFTAISSFSIYFAQEARLYSLLFLFSALAILFTINLLKKFTIKHTILLLISSIFIIITHTLGIIYVFFLLITTSFYIISGTEDIEKKSRMKYILYFTIIPFIVVAIIISPLLYHIATYGSLSQFWNKFSIAKIILTFTDYFSPVQLNIISSFSNLSFYLYRNNQVNYSYILYSIIPSLMALAIIIYSLFKKNKTLNCLFLSSILFFICLIIISLAGKMILLTKYSIEIYPTLILMLAYGFMEISRTKLRNVLIIAFLGIQLIYLCLYKDAAFRLQRADGHAIPVQLIKSSGLKNKDFIIVLYVDENKFNKYFNLDEHYNIHSINKFNFNIFLYKDPDYKDVIKNGKVKYKDVLKEIPNKNIVEYTNNNFIEKMEIGDKIGIISLNNVIFLSNKSILDIVNDEKKYNDTPFIFPVFSDIKNSMLYSFKDKFILESELESGYWNLMVFQKIKN